MAVSKQPAKGVRGARGRMPNKRSINLVKVDENRISIPKAVLGILLIVALAGLFGKYLVYDRLMAVSEAQARVNRLQNTLDEAMTQMRAFGDVETTYAHYTLDGMTQAELDLVDRVDVLELVGSILPAQAEAAAPDEAGDDWDEDDWDEDDWDDEDDLADGADAEAVEEGFAIQSWTVTENVLTIEAGGPTLEDLNRLAHQLEGSPIVDSCTISTANKATGRSTDGRVWAKLIVYLTRPVEEVEAP